MIRSADTALLFPGQGSQVEGMRERVERARPDLLERVLAEVGTDPFERASESTRFAQPAIFCASVAALPPLIGDSTGWMAGHSLGEFAALVGAGSLAAEDGLRLVALRGRLMDEAAGGAGAMAALVGAEAAAAASEIAFETGTHIANHNSPTQIVLAGPEGAIAEACRIGRDRGLRGIVLPVRGAFHTPLMAAARAPFEAALAEVEFLPPRVEVISAVTAEPFEDPPAQLAAALTEPVRWREVLESLEARGARRFLEVGPGKVLTGLVRKTLAGVEAMTVEQTAHA